MVGNDSMKSFFAQGQINKCTSKIPNFAISTESFLKKSIFKEDQHWRFFSKIQIRISNQLAMHFNIKFENKPENSFAKAKWKYI